MSPTERERREREREDWMGLKGNSFASFVIALEIKEKVTDSESLSWKKQLMSFASASVMRFSLTKKLPMG
jgi:hypothetical protein